MEYYKLEIFIPESHFVGLRKALQEVEQLRSQLRKESNIEKQELKREESMSRKLVKKFMNMLKTNNTRFNKAYDLNNEADVVEFLSWYKMIKRPVNKKTIRDMSRLKCTEPGAEELFLRLVEEHNAEFGNAVEEIEENVNYYTELVKEIKMLAHFADKDYLPNYYFRYVFFESC